MTRLAVALTILLFAVAIPASLFFLLGRNAALKRRIFPWYNVAVGVLFCAIVASDMRRWEPLLFVIPAVAFVMWWNTRIVKFCDGCGRTIFNNVWFARARFCSFCGHPLYKDKLQN